MYICNVSLNAHTHQYMHAHNFCKTRMQDESLILNLLTASNLWHWGYEYLRFQVLWIRGCRWGGGKKASLLHDVEGKRIQGISIWTYSVSSSFSTDFYSIFQSCQEVHHIVSNLLYIKRFNATKSFMPSALCQAQRKLVSGGVIEFESIVSKRPFKRDAERAAHTHVRQTWSDTGFDCKWLEHVGASM